jgi:hypothetical protein
MQLSAVLLARALAYIESFDLNPRGKVFYPDLVKGMVEKFGFLKFPEKAEDLDETKGIDFIGGKWGNVTVEKLTIYQNGLLLDTRASTAESERIIEEGLAWASSTFGLIYEPKMIKRRGYLSNLCFYSACPFLLKSSLPVSKLTERVHNAVGKITGDKTPWEPTILTIHSESIPRKPVGAPFTIQRRAETAFSENKYYSEAPLPTDEHVRLLEAFEADALAGGSAKV